MADVLPLVRILSLRNPRRSRCNHSMFFGVAYEGHETEAGTTRGANCMMANRSTGPPLHTVVFTACAIAFIGLSALAEAKSYGKMNVKSTSLGEELQDGGDAVANTTGDIGRSEVAVLDSSLTVIKHSLFGPNHRFCRLKGVCRTGEGTVIVPSWMKAYSEHVAKCGIDRVLYSLENSPGLERSGEVTAVREDESQITLKEDFREHDVIGNKAPRVERGLLATDITPSLFLLDLFSRPGAYYNSTTTLCTKRNGVQCGPKNYSDMSSLNPLLFIDSRIGETKDFLWPKSLLRLVRNSKAGALEVTDLKDLFGWRVRSEASCFHSIISTNVIASEIPPEAINSDHIFFTRNHLSRLPVRNAGLASQSCTSKVLILNQYGKRFIEGCDKLRLAISSLGQEIRKLDKRIVIEPEVVFFENSSFHEQVSVMQESSVVVATHGDGNANFMFLRPESRVFEILPFGFSSDVYRSLSRVYGSVYSKLVGQPDGEVFLACMQHFNPTESEEREEFIAGWRAAAQNFKEETIRTKANVISTYLVPQGDNESEIGTEALQHLRQCASYQRIAVDIKHLARQVTKAAAEQCHFTGDAKLLWS